MGKPSRAKQTAIAQPRGLPRRGSSARPGAQLPGGTPKLADGAGTARSRSHPRVSGRARPAFLLRHRGRRGGDGRGWAPPSRASSPSRRRHLLPCPYSAGAAILCPPRALCRPWRGCCATSCSSAWRPPAPAPTWCWRRCGVRWTSARTWPRSRPSSASPTRRAARPPLPSCWRWSPGWSRAWPTWACR